MPPVTGYTAEKSQRPGPGDLVVNCEDLIDIHLPENLRHADFVMGIQYSDRLVCLVRNESVYRAFLSRVGLAGQYRKEAIEGLGKIHGTQFMEEWMAAIQRLDRHGVVLDPRKGGRNPNTQEIRSVLDDYVDLLSVWATDQPAIVKRNSQKLIKESQLPQIRQLGYAGLLESGVDIDDVWQMARKNNDGIQDLLSVGRWAPISVRDKLWKKATVSKSLNPDALVALILFAQYVPGEDQDIFEFLTSQIETAEKDSHLVNAAVVALLAREPVNWPLAGMDTLGLELLRRYSALDVADRSSSGAKRLKSLIDRIADLLPPEKRSLLERQLVGMEVAEVKITALREQMAFDRDVLVLQAGQPVEITFKNDDQMPHNLVVVRPGSMEKVGVAADQLALVSSESEKQYVPQIPEVLHHTGMIDSGKSAKLVFEVPAEEGVYPILCSFPGHWLKMFSAMVVTADREAYLAKNDPLPERDALLGVRNYTHRFEPLATRLLAGNEQRSFTRGQTAFYSRACVSCHAVGGKGGRVGPELSALGNKQKPTDILRSILYPSEKIDPEYAKVEVEHLETGKLVAGVLIPQEDPDVVYLVDDPLAECEPQVFNRKDVEITPLKISPMPEELLRRSSPAEVLDLVAYLLSGGNPEHPVFSDAKKND